MMFRVGFTGARGMTLVQCIKDLITRFNACTRNSGFSNDQLGCLEPNGTTKFKILKIKEKETNTEHGFPDERYHRRLSRQKIIASLKHFRPIRQRPVQYCPVWLSTGVEVV